MELNPLTCAVDAKWKCIEKTSNGTYDCSEGWNAYFTWNNYSFFREKIFFTGEKSTQIVILLICKVDRISGENLMEWETVFFSNFLIYQASQEVNVPFATLQ